MEEVQSWWEVPAIAHFCDVFRSVFDLFFFEIAELESAILNIQDPDMSISLEQLIIKLLQGFYDDDVNEGNWEEKLHELFDENLENDENPLENSASFLQSTPRSKVEILFKLCEMRLDVEGVMEEIKNIPSEDMQAKCIGKDSQNFTYWYFCDERLYKEDSSTGNNAKLPDNKSTKNTSNKRKTNSREKKSKKNSKVDQPWTIACFNISDWEKMMNKLSKSKNSEEKKLVTAIKDHLPLLEEKVAEKDRQLRKRFVELAPKRSSSRISKVQEKKKMEELKAQELSRKAKLEAEKERAKKEALEMQMKKESRQRRAEERQKAMEERAERAKLRELARSEDNDSGDEDESDDNKDNSDENNDSDDKDYQLKKNQRGAFPKSQRIGNNYSSQYQQRESYADASKNRFPSFSYRRISQSARFGNETSTSNTRQYALTFKVQTGYNEPRTSAPIQNAENCVKASLMPIVQNTTDESSSKESGEVMSSDINNPSIIDKKQIIKNNFVHLGSLLSKQDSTTLNANFSNRSQDTNGSNLSPKVTVYKTSVFQNASDVSKWHAAFGSKGQKVQILSGSQDSLASKKIKLEPVKNFRSIPPSAKPSPSKENVIFKPVQTAFITYGKIIPNRSPAIVKLDYRQPPNPPVSS